MQKFITYSGEGEVIITTPDNETDTIREFFTNGGRDLEEYDREEGVGEAVLVKRGHLQVRF